MASSVQMLPRQLCSLTPIDIHFSVALALAAQVPTDPASIHLDSRQLSLCMTTNWFPKHSDM